MKKLKHFLKENMLPFLMMAFYNSVCKLWINVFAKRDDRDMKYYLSICLMFKNEAPFLKEWLDYHLTIGVDHFYLYNNNSDDNYREVLKNYIENGVVSLIDFPKPNAQFEAYMQCYNDFRKDNNWIMFLDADEFLCPKYEINIKTWLKKYNKFHAVNIHWLMFGTGGILEHDYSRNVIEQYFASWDRLSPHGKTIINTRYEIANSNRWYLHHHTYMYRKIFGIRMVVPAVNQFGYICTIDKTWGGGNNKYNNSNIQINHYFTKSWSIWSEKMKKTDVLFTNNPKSDINYFYKYEDLCRSRDYTIQRFLIRMKIFQNIIK